MTKNLLLVLFITVFTPLIIQAQWIALDGKTEQLPPSVKLLDSDSQSTIISIELSGFEVREIVAGATTYQSISLLTEMFTTEEGFAEIPYIAKILAIPDQAAATVEILETGKIETFKNIHLPPARKSWPEGKPEPPYIEDTDAYKSSDLYPAVAAEMDDPSILRDFRISRLAVYPVRYNAAKSEIQVVSSMIVKVNYGKGEIINPKTSRKNPIAPSYADLYRSSIFNYQEVLNEYYNGREDGRDVMLCIMPDEFTESFQVYADWKRQSGTDIHITKFSDIGANGNNPDIIKEHVTQSYNNWGNPPTYVLIIGDNGIFPKKIVTYPGYSFPWEEFFVTVEGNDYFPEMMIGRFTNQGDYRMQVMINKFMLYEKQPYTSDVSWFKKGTCCSNNDYESQVETKRFAAQVMLEDGLFTSVDTMMSDGNGWGQGCTYNIGDIKAAINEGRSYLNYRGEGWSYGWYASCYDFSTSDVSSLNNGQKFTFVTSIGCGVAMFDASGGNCFGEEWVQLGSLTSPRGGIGFIGPTSNTHTTYNNRIDKGIYVGMFREAMDTPGQAMARGKLYMYNVFGNEYYVEYHYKVFCVLGDPSIHIWKDVPLSVDAGYPEIIPVGHSDVEFTITHTASGLPVNNAQVTVTGQELFYSVFTDETGTVEIDIMPEMEETLNVTVRGGNVIPFQGTMEVIQADELVEPEGEPLLEDLDGNQDGLINPNENGAIQFELKNWGSTTASNVTAVLSTQDEFIQILSTSPVSYGNIPPGEIVQGEPFQFFIDPECPIDHTIQLQLHVESALFSWDFYFDLQIAGCMLEFENFLVFDAASPSPNAKADPGETVDLVIQIANHGQDIAPDVAGQLTSNDTYIEIIDGAGYFGTMDMNTLITNAEDYFTVAISPNCPTAHFAVLSLNIETQNGNYPYQKTIEIQLPVGISVPKDYTGPDAYGYFAYSSDDTFYDETPEYDWVELHGPGTQILMPEISSYTKNVDLPFTFKYYGNDFDQIRVSTDGWMAFGSGTQTAPNNAQLPANDNVNNMVAVMWDNLYDEEFFMGKFFYHHDEANHRFIIQWDSISHANFIEDPVREVFQVHLYDPVHHVTQTGDGEIIMQFKLVQQPETVSTGIENDLQDIGIHYVFNNNYNPTATNLVSNYALKFTTDPPFEGMGVGINSPASETAKANTIISQPNPFSQQTDINFKLTNSQYVDLNIFDSNGKLIKNLISSPMNPGDHHISWNGKNENGFAVKSGVYFCRLQSGELSETIKIIVLR
jgi:hypothetical protein